MDTSVRRYVGTTVQRHPPHVGIEKKKRHAERRLSPHTLCCSVRLVIVSTRVKALFSSPSEHAVKYDLESLSSELCRRSCLWQAGLPVSSLQLDIPLISLVVGTNVSPSSTSSPCACLRCMNPRNLNSDQSFDLRYFFKYCKQANDAH